MNIFEVKYQKKPTGARKQYTQPVRTVEVKSDTEENAKEVVMMAYANFKRNNMVVLGCKKMSEKILEIAEVCGKDMDGYKVVTEKHTYLVLIDNDKCCCEDWGYITSEDDINYYIGSELIEVQLIPVDTEKTRKMEEAVGDVDCGGIQFVTFITNKGNFQLAVYNSHNGYYGHEIIISKDETMLFHGNL